MRDFGRRRFLSLAAVFGLCTSPRASPAAQQPGTIDLEAFLALSRRLTGRQELDRQLARTYLSALLAESGNAERLLQLGRNEPAAARSKALVDLEQEIVAAWYTGVCRVNGTTQLITHNGALMWAALSRPAPGVCAGVTGAWAQPRGTAR